MTAPPSHLPSRSPQSHGPGAGDALLGQIAIGAIITLGAVGLVAWSGAQLAAIVFGDGPLPVTVAVGGKAVLDLPAHAKDPAIAWPENVRPLLPGPFAYWACTALVTAVAITIAALSAWFWLRSRRGNAHALGVEPNAGFARPNDIKKLVIDQPQPGRLTLGHVGRVLVAAEPQVSLAVVGPTGCGKTVGFAIPALLEWQGPIIATSVKNDLLDAALAHRQQRGTVWVYDPTATTGHPAARWSPLAACDTWAGAMRIAAWLCEAAQPRVDTVNDGDYWYTQARKALAPYLLAAANGDKTMRDVVRWIDTQDQDEVTAILQTSSGLNAVLDRLLASDQATERRQALEPEALANEIAIVREQLVPLGGGGKNSWEMQEFSRWRVEQQAQLRERVNNAVEQRIVAEFSEIATAQVRETGALDALISAEALWNKEERLRGSVFATVENVLSGYADPGVGQAAEGSDIDLAEWLNGDNTIFVVATAHEQARLRPVLTVLIQQAIRTAYESANTSNGTLTRPCLVLLDEAGNIAPLRDLPGYASTARSHGITLVSIWQDLAQIKSIYGDRAQTVLNNHRAKLFGTGIADEATLEYVSRLIGDERRTEVNMSGDLHGGRRSVSEHINYRRAAPADLLRRIKTNEAVLVYGSELPAHLRLRPWYAKRAKP
ncbi:MAG: type IV secretory system conjugative DNA transfer family protein [Acidimicrobiia bacterium]